MNRTDQELDKYGKRVLMPLRSSPNIDPKTAEEIKAKFLNEGENARQGLLPQSNHAAEENRKPRIFRLLQPTPIMKFLVAVIIAMAVLVGSSLTVYASQSSLPGEALYVIKSWSEDVRLVIASSPQAKLDLTLSFTDRRLNEITNLVESGKALPAQTSARYQGELENALQLAAEMDNGEMKDALEKIKNQAESQGMTFEELINMVPEQARPAAIGLLTRLQEQVMLSDFGNNDPQAFRSEIRERQHNNSRAGRSTPMSEETGTPSRNNAATATPKEDRNDQGKDKSHPTVVPDRGNPGNSQGKSTPGAGNRNHGPQITPTP